MATFQMLRVTITESPQWNPVTTANCRRLSTMVPPTHTPEHNSVHETTVTIATMTWMSWRCSGCLRSWVIEADSPPWTTVEDKTNIPGQMGAILCLGQLPSWVSWQRSRCWRSWSQVTKAGGGDLLVVPSQRFPNFASKPQQWPDWHSPVVGSNKEQILI